MRTYIAFLSAHYYTVFPKAMNDDLDKFESTSYWSHIRGKVDWDPELDDQIPQRIAKRQKVVLKETPGVAYEWITNPWSWSSVDGFQWHEVDHFFRGASVEEMVQVEESLKKKEKNDPAKEKKQKVSNGPFKWIKIETYPDELFSKTGLPQPSELQGIYDVIYYGGEHENYMRHNRTAWGTLELTSVNSDDKAILRGSIKMDPRMQRIDVIPFGGDFVFEETARMQRVANDIYTRDSTSLSTPYEPVTTPKRTKPTGVIKICATNPPEGVSVYNMFLKEKCAFPGELRIFEKRTAAGYMKERGGYNSDEIQESEIKFDSVQSAENLLRRHYEKTCCYLHAHTILTPEVCTKVGEYLCPLPVLFFERGDICIDMDWTSGLERTMTGTCLIARRRNIQASTNDSSQKLLISPKQQCEREVNEYDKAIANLTLERDALKFALYCYQEITTTESLRLEFVEEDEEFGLAKRTLMYKEELFLQQMTKHGLCMESKEFSHPMNHSVCYSLTFSWLPKENSLQR